MFAPIGPWLRAGLHIVSSFFYRVCYGADTGLMTDAHLLKTYIGKPNDAEIPSMLKIEFCCQCIGPYLRPNTQKTRRWLMDHRPAFPLS